MELFFFLKKSKNSKKDGRGEPVGKVLCQKVRISLTSISSLPLPSFTVWFPGPQRYISRPCTLPAYGTNVSPSKHHKVPHRRPGASRGEKWWERRGRAGHEGIGAGQSSEGSDPKDYSTVAELVFFYPCLEYQSLQSMWSEVFFFTLVNERTRGAHRKTLTTAVWSVTWEERARHKGMRGCRKWFCRLDIHDRKFKLFFFPPLLTAFPSCAGVCMRVCVKGVLAEHECEYARLEEKGFGCVCMFASVCARGIAFRQKSIESAIFTSLFRVEGFGWGGGGGYRSRREERYDFKISMVKCKESEVPNTVPIAIVASVAMP